MKAEFISDLNELTHRKVRKERKAQLQCRKWMNRIGWIFTDSRFLKNRQTLSAKLGLPNNIGYFCHQLWQKFTRHEKLAKEYMRRFNERNRWHIRNFCLSFLKVNALRSELLFSVIYLDAVHRKVGSELWFIIEHEKNNELVRTKTNSGGVSSFRVRCVRL